MHHYKTRYGLSNLYYVWSESGWDIPHEDGKMEDINFHQKSLVLKRIYFFLKHFLSQERILVALYKRFLCMAQQSLKRIPVTQRLITAMERKFWL